MTNTKINIDYTFIVGPLDDLPDVSTVNVTSGMDGKAMTSIDVPKNVLSITLIVIN